MMRANLRPGLPFVKVFGPYVRITEPQPREKGYISPVIASTELAETNAGEFWSASADVIVTLAACIEDIT